MIYPMQKINIPNLDETKGVEQEVLTLVNQERSKAGLKPLADGLGITKGCKGKIM